MIAPLGRRWFSVDSKSFEIKVEGEGRKAQVIITERRRGGSSWIRFREEGVRILLKGVESFRRETGKISEGGRMEGGTVWNQRKTLLGASFSARLLMKMVKDTACSFLKEVV